MELHSIHMYILLEYELNILKMLVLQLSYELHLR
jgi:hypothetical protein